MAKNTWKLFAGLTILWLFVGAFIFKGTPIAYWIIAFVLAAISFLTYG